jgi:hypothetical protein
MAEYDWVRVDGLDPPESSNVAPQTLIIAVASKCRSHADAIRMTNTPS